MGNKITNISWQTKAVPSEHTNEAEVKGKQINTYSQMNDTSLNWTGDIKKVLKVTTEQIYTPEKDFEKDDFYHLSNSDTAKSGALSILKKAADEARKSEVYTSTFNEYKESESKVNLDSAQKVLKSAGGEFTWYRPGQVHANVTVEVYNDNGDFDKKFTENIVFYNDTEERSTGRGSDSDYASHTIAKDYPGAALTIYVSDALGVYNEETDKLVIEDQKQVQYDEGYYDPSYGIEQKINTGDKITQEQGKLALERIIKITKDASQECTYRSYCGTYKIKHKDAVDGYIPPKVIEIGSTTPALQWHISHEDSKYFANEDEARKHNNGSDIITSWEI